jgi:hypothetical protein
MDRSDLRWFLFREADRLWAQIRELRSRRFILEAHRKIELRELYHLRVKLAQRMLREGISANKIRQYSHIPQETLRRHSDKPPRPVSEVAKRIRALRSQPPSRENNFELRRLYDLRRQLAELMLRQGISFIQTHYFTGLPLKTLTRMKERRHHLHPRPIAISLP